MRFYSLCLILALFVQRDVESIHGTVLLDDQAPGKDNIIIRLEINRYGASGPGVATHVSEEGEYWFHQLSEGDYKITASAPGYRTTESRFEVHRGGQVRGNTKLNLEKVPELPVISYDGQLISRNELAAPAAARKHMRAARAAFQKNDQKTAAQEAELALKAYPRYARAIFLKGQIAALKGQGAAAASFYEQSLSLDPDLYPAYPPLSEYYRKQERVAELRKLADAWKQKQPTESAAYFYSAVALYEAGEYASALNDALLAFRFPHTHLPHVRLLLANTYVKLKQPADALAQLEAFVQEYPADPQAPEARATMSQLRKLVQRGAEATDKER